MTNTRPHPDRRQALTMGLGAWAAACALPSLTLAYTAMGPTEPRRAPPELLLTLHDGRQQPLSSLLKGRVTALQLMFTGCSATCPVQGAQFAALQAKLQGLKLDKTQLLSLSIDPLNDDATALANWRRKYGAGPQWLAAAPSVRHAQTMLDFLSARSRPTGDVHKAQTYLFDQQGLQAFTFAEMASATDMVPVIATVLNQVR